MSTAHPSTRIVPYLVYEDAPAAIEFLVKAFGFVERMRFMMDDGRVGHAELTLDGHAIYLASAYSELGFASPRDLGGIHTQLLCYVEDVDAHFARARDAGATVIAEPYEDHGSRMYRAVDTETGRWIFATEIEAEAER